jgi:hypothetical protein
VCARCGGDLSDARKGVKYCRECAPEVHRKQARERQRVKKAGHPVCERCGAELLGERWGIRFCAACRPVRRAEWLAEYKRSRQEAKGVGGEGKEGVSGSGRSVVGVATSWPRCPPGRTR